MPRWLSTRLARALVGVGVVLAATIAYIAVARASNPTPHSLAPSAAPNTGPVTVAIEGTGFDAGATARFERTGQPAIAGAAVQYVTPERLQATFDITNVSPGRWDLHVTNPDGGTNKCAGCFRVAANPPAVTSAGGPVGQGAKDKEVELGGVSFFPGAAASFSGEGVSVSSTRYVGITSVVASVDVDPGAAIGPRNVTVTNTDGQSATCTGCLTVDAAPAVSSSDPSSLDRGATQQDVSIGGIGFVDGAAAAFSGAGIKVNGVRFVPGPLPKLVANLTVAADAERGARKISVTNPDGGTGSCGTCFVISTPPRVNATDPSGAGEGATDRAITVTGANFVDGAKASFGPGVKVSSSKVASGTSLVATIDVDPDAAAGARDVTVTNPDPNVEAGSCVGCFSVAPAPRVRSATPGSRGQGADSQELALASTGLAPGASVKFSGTGIDVLETVVVGPAVGKVSIDVAADAPTGPRDVLVRNSDGGVSSCAGCFTVNPAPAPSALDPSSRGQGAAAQDVALTGAGFSQGAKVSVSGSGVTVLSSTVQSATRIAVNLTVAPDAPTGRRNITVTNTDAGASGSCGGCLTVNASPTVIAASPSSRDRDAADQEVTLTGTGFLPGATASFGPGVTVSASKVGDSKTLVATVSIDPDASPGERTVKVTNPDGSPSASCQRCFTVNGGLTVTGAVPEAAPNGSAAGLTVNGTGFASDAAVRLLRLGQPDVAGTSVVVESRERLKANFDIVGAAPGPWELRVTNVGTGGTNVCTKCFTVASSAPKPTAASPESVPQGADGRDVVLKGANLARGAAVAFSGSGIGVESTTFTDPGTLTVKLSIAAGAAPGARDVTVTNTDTQAGTCKGCLTVRVAPSVTSMSPDSRGQGAADQKVTITGAGFVSGADLAFSGTGIVVTATTFSSATEIRASVTVASVAAPGPRDLSLTNPDGQKAGCAGCFTVNAAPTVASASPGSRGQGAKAEVLNISGTNFASGAKLSISGSGVTVSSPEVSSPTSMAADVTVEPDAVVGPRDVVVANPDGGASTSCAGCFTVTVGPVVGSVSPSSRGQGAAVQEITIVGRHFGKGATVAFSGTGITVNSVQFVPPAPDAPDLAKLVANVTVSQGATSNARNVKVTNSDAGTGSCSDCFTVNPLPAVSSVSPTSKAQGAGGDEITVSGSGFLSGAVASFSGSGISVVSTTVKDANTLLAKVAVVPAATVGKRDVKVQNPDGGSPGVCAACFAVNAAPVLKAASPGSGGQGATGRDVTVTGTDFSSAAKVSFSGAGIIVSSTDFVSSTAVVLRLDIAPSAPLGSRDLTVTNFDGGTGECVACFAVNPGPVAVSASPGSRGQGATSEAITLTGSGFQPGAEVSLSGAGVIAGSTTRQSPTALLVDLSVSPGAATGPRGFTVTNPDGGRSLPCTACFSVNDGPAVTALEPDSLTQGASGQGVAFDGSNLADGATVVFSGSGISVDSVAFPPAPAPADVAKPKATLSLALDAPVGPRDVSVRNPDGGRGSCIRCFAVGPARGRYTPLDPARILDTRAGAPGKLGPGQTIDVQVAGKGGIPAAGVSAVVLNATVSEPSDAGYLTIFPTGVERPLASNLNFARGDTVPNLVTVKLGTGGKVSVYNYAGRAHLIFDVAGWYDTNPAGKQGRYQPLLPARIADSRAGKGIPRMIGPGQAVDVQVVGEGGVPSSGAAAVVLNATVTEPTAAGFLTVYPAGRDRPLASNLNFVPGQTVPNRVVVKLGQGGKVSVYNSSGSAHVILDVNGWITDESVTSGVPGALTGVTPSRILDTRSGEGASKISSAGTKDVQIAGKGGEPSTASAVVLNATVTDPTAAGYLTIFPAGAARPLASDLNFVPGQTVPNLVVVKLGEGGKVSIYNASGSTAVIFDVVGWL